MARKVHFSIRTLGFYLSGFERIFNKKLQRYWIDITTLNAEIAGIVARQNELRTAIDEIVADLEGTK